MSALPRHPWFGQELGRPTERPHVPRELLEQAQIALRDLDADCSNLRGVIAERRGDWPLTRRPWFRAARADKRCLAARWNLARYYELFTWGRCRDAVALGDESGCRR